MLTQSHPGLRDRSLALRAAVDVRPAAKIEQGLAHASLRHVEPKEVVFAERAPISHLCGIETGAIALYRSLSDGRRQVIGLAFVIAGRGGVRMAVQAMKAGAVDFIDMPVGHKKRLASVERALHQIQDSTTFSVPRETDATRVATLTARQRQVLNLVIAGHPSKNIAADLGISRRTVENHRAAIMRKTGSKSIPALIRTALGVA